MIMNAMNETKVCLTCNKPIRGRTDKRFCDDQCRSTYHNQTRPPLSDFARAVNRHLQKNRAVLMQLVTDPSGRAVVTKAKMEDMGFAFHYHTHTYTNKKGNTYFYTYEYGWLELPQGKCLVLKREGT